MVKRAGNTMKESAVQNHTREQFAYIGPIWRNNSGACEDKTGRLIRYGLGNDSAKLNKEIKSSDLIGITPTIAFVPNIGWQTLGIFTALECKPSDWHIKSSDERAQAQLKFHDIVRQHGGYAGFVTKPDDIFSIIRR